MALQKAKQVLGGLISLLHSGVITHHDYELPLARITSRQADLIPGGGQEWNATMSSAATVPKDIKHGTLILVSLLHVHFLKKSLSTSENATFISSSACSNLE